MTGKEGNSDQNSESKQSADCSSLCSSYNFTLNLVLFPNRKEKKENVFELFSSMCSLYHKSRELANLECSLAPFNMFQILNKNSARWINRTLPSDYTEE